MTNKIIATLLFLVCSNASAHHELIVVPDTNVGSASHENRHERSRHRSHDKGHKRAHERTRSAYNGGLYLTPYLAVGLGGGGDEVGRFEDNFGDVETVRSGGGFFMEGGVLLALDSYTRLRFTGGYEVDSVGRLNGDSSFDRVRFDAMLLRNFGFQELGIGVTAHTGVGFNCDINTICTGDVEFDNAVGLTAEYALTTFNMRSGGLYDRRLYPLRDARLGVRFTGIEYRPEINGDPDLRTLDGSSISLFFGFAF